MFWASIKYFYASTISCPHNIIFFKRAQRNTFIWEQPKFFILYIAVSKEPYVYCQGYFFESTRVDCFMKF